MIPHTWRLANMVPVPKPNGDTDRGTSCMPMSLLSVIVKTLERSLLPYITADMPDTPMQHGCRARHSAVTALHTPNNTVAEGFSQMAPPARTNTVALDMSKASDTHTHWSEGCCRRTFRAQSLSSSQTASGDTKPTQHIEITHPNNVNLKLASLQLHPHTHHIVTPGFVDIPRRSDCTAGQMDGEAGWWTTSGNIGLPPLARVMEWVDNNMLKYLGSHFIIE